MAITWTKVSRTENDEGVTIVYSGGDTGITIESRKRHIPHAGGRSGTWDHTTFTVLYMGVEIATKYSLADAKLYVDELRRGK